MYSDAEEVEMYGNPPAVRLSHSIHHFGVNKYVWDMPSELRAFFVRAALGDPLSNKKSISEVNLGTAFRMHRKFLAVLSAGDRFDRWTDRQMHFLTELMMDVVEMIAGAVWQVIAGIWWFVTFPFVWVGSKIRRGWKKILKFFGCIRDKDSVVARIKAAKKEAARHAKMMHREVKKREAVHRSLEMQKNGETEWSQRKKAMRTFLADNTGLFGRSSTKKIGVDGGGGGDGDGETRRGSLDIREGQLELYAMEGELGKKEARKKQAKNAKKAKKEETKAKKEAARAKVAEAKETKAAEKAAAKAAKEKEKEAKPEEAGDTIGDAPLEKKDKSKNKKKKLSKEPKNIAVTPVEG
jgi:hypothetical protein